MLRIVSAERACGACLTMGGVKEGAIPRDGSLEPLRVPAWIVVPGILGFVGGLIVSLLGLAFAALALTPMRAEPGEDIGRGAGMAFTLVFMALFIPLGLGGGVGGLVIAQGRLRWLPRFALALVAAGVACVLLLFGWGALLSLVR
jgi:hypothetical protein